MTERIGKSRVTYIDHMGSDMSVVNAARVSHDKESEWNIDVSTGRRVLSPKDEKLIFFLAREAHKSPFNHCFMSVRVKAPIFVARQLVKHEYLAWNEVSRRYVKDNLDFYIPDIDDWRSVPDENIKQGSGDPLSNEVAEHLEKHYVHLINDALRMYDLAIKEGLCPEQARMVLPQSLMTEWIWSGSLYAFAKMCHLRMGEHSQKESKDVAKQVHGLLSSAFPVSTAALTAWIGSHA